MSYEYYSLNNFSDSISAAFLGFRRSILDVLLSNLEVNFHIIVIFSCILVSWHDGGSSEFRCFRFIARALKFYHFLMVFTAKSERELSAKSIVSFHFSQTI
jgi:hypothetical protein